MNEEGAAPEGDLRAGGKGRSDQQRIRIEQHSASGMFWIIGWLFTIGFVHLSFWKGALALLIWPYYLGTTVATLLTR